MERGIQKIFEQENTQPSRIVLIILPILLTDHTSNDIDLELLKKTANITAEDLQSALNDLQDTNLIHKQNDQWILPSVIAKYFSIHSDEISDELASSNPMFFKAGCQPS